MYDMMPRIKLEVDGMKLQIVQALDAYTLQMNGNIKHILDNVCTKENITRIIQQTADKEINNAIEQEVQNFFRYGEGRHAISDAVKNKLSDKIER
jgi:hypothetical protein